MARATYQQQEIEDPQEKQLRQILQLAEIDKAVQEPELTRRGQDITDRASNLRTALGVLGLQNEAETQRELARYHTGELEHGTAAISATREETAARERESQADVAARREATAASERESQARTKSSLQEQTVQSFAPLVSSGQVSVRALAGALRRGGNPELADQLDEERTRDVNSKVLFNAAQIGLYKGDRNKIAKHMAGIADPEVKAQLQPQVDAILNPQGQQPGAAPVTPPVVQPPAPVGHPAPPTFDVDKFLQTFVGNPSMEDLRKRQLSSQAVLDTANTQP